MKVKSNQIKIYPSSLRSDKWDRNARLTSEQNLISVINRIVNKDSFIISGLDISNNTISSGQCSIHGYYFDITDNITLSDTLASATDIYLGIRVQKTNTNPNFIQLTRYDDNLQSGGELLSLDSDESATSEFKGLEIASSKPSGDDFYSLHLATKVDGTWKKPYNSTLKFDISEIDYESKNETFIEYLTEDFSIDDGEIN